MFASSCKRGLTEKADGIQSTRPTDGQLAASCGAHTAHECRKKATGQKATKMVFHYA